MELVDGSIDPHRDHQGILMAPLSHPVEDAGESCAAHMSGTRGNALADQMDNVTIQSGGKDTQGGQDVVDLLPVPSVTKNQRRRKMIISLQFDNFSSEQEVVSMRPYWCSPFHLRDEARVEASASLQDLRGLSVKQQVFIHQLHQNQSDQLAHVLPTDQLLVTTGDK